MQDSFVLEKGACLSTRTFIDIHGDKEVRLEGKVVQSKAKDGFEGFERYLGFYTNVDNYAAYWMMLDDLLDPRVHCQKDMFKLVEKRLFESLEGEDAKALSLAGEVFGEAIVRFLNSTSDIRAIKQFDIKNILFDKQGKRTKEKLSYEVIKPLLEKSGFVLACLKHIFAKCDKRKADIRKIHEFDKLGELKIYAQTMLATASASKQQREHGQEYLAKVAGEFKVGQKHYESLVEQLSEP